MTDARIPSHARQGRLRLPPVMAEGAVAEAGRRVLEVDGRAAGLLYAPGGVPDRLVVMLHGAGGGADDAMRLLEGHATDAQLMIFAPDAVGRTWDVIDPGYGPDVVRIEAALTSIIGTYRLNRPGLVIGGFSDGASYALSLGLGNGDVFGAVLAFSPGFAAPGTAVGAPACFVSHGRADTVLPIDRCSRRIVAGLRRASYPVHYHEFGGGHQVPEPVVAEALHWLSSLPGPTG